MILSKMLVNQIATYLTKHFKLDKMMAYVFDKNELDAKVEQLEKRINLLENFKCNYKPKEEDNG
tara:strand:- start:6469 stop:6660 length:192 start_codon:yes stop_codon:yes gene_type:complete